MKYSFLDESFDSPVDAANRMADNYLPETSGEQYEDDRWYAMRRMEDMRPGESIWINGFKVTAKEM
jgi:hypothetical protein